MAFFAMSDAVIQHFYRHCEEDMADFAMADAAIQHFKDFLDCFASSQ